MPRKSRKRKNTKYKPRFQRGQHVLFEGDEYMVVCPDRKNDVTIRLMRRFRPYARPHKIVSIREVKKNRHEKRNLLKKGDFVYFDFNSSPGVLSYVFDRIGDDLQIQPIHVRHIFQLSVYSNRIGLIDFDPMIETYTPRIPILYNPLLQARGRTNSDRRIRIVDYEVEADRYLITYINGEVDWARKDDLIIEHGDKDSHECNWIQVGELSFDYNDLEIAIGCSYSHDSIKSGDVDIESVKRDVWYHVYQSGFNHFASRYSKPIEILALLMWMEHYPTYWKKQMECTYSDDEWIQEVDNKLMESLMMDDPIDILLMEKIEKRKHMTHYVRRRAANIENILRGKPIFKTNFYFYDDKFKVQVMNPEKATRRSYEFSQTFVFNYVSKILWYFSNRPDAPTWVESHHMMSEYQLARHSTKVNMKIPLKPFQEQIVYDMNEREKTIENIPMTLTTRDGVKFNAISGFDYTFLFRGGILSLGTGMGKTICTLGLIASTVKEIRPTLVVVPLTLIDQWIQELKRFTNLSYAEIHGRKNKTEIALQKDVVFTTYGTLAARSDKTDFFTNNFRRVVFDESHQLKTPHSSKVRACYEVNAIYRWCLTATPLRKGTFLNLHSQLKMLSVRPFHVSTPILKLVMEQEDERSKWIIHELSKLIIKPNLENHIYIPKHREENILVEHPNQILYNCMYNTVREAIDEFYSEGTIYRNFQRVKSMMNKLSICSIDPKLIPIHAWGELIETEGFLQTNVETLSSELKDSSFQKEVKETLQNLKDTSCCLCLENITRPTITNCLHIFCHDCIKRSLEFNSKCPMCRGQLIESRFKEIKESEEEIKEDDTWVYTKDVYGRKVKIVKEIYKQYNKPSKNYKLEKLKEIIAKRDKVVVYSQYNTVLEAFSKQIDSCIITGKSSRSKRKRNMEEFKNGKSKVFFLSTKVADVGINLTEGDTLVFLEPGLENDVKEQAIGRLKRIGQEKSIHIYNLFSKNTIEEKVDKASKRFNECLTNLMASTGSRSYKSKRKKQLILGYLLNILEVN